MENPFRRRTVFEFEEFLCEAVAHCQHGHPSFLRARVPEQSPQSCRDSAVLQAWTERFCQADPRAAAHRPATPERNRPGACPPVGRIKACATSPKRAICFRLRVRDYLEKKTEGASGFVSSLRPFDTLRQAQGPGSGHRRLDELGDGKVPEFFQGFRIGGTRVQVGGISRIVLYVNPYLMRLVILGKYFKKRQVSHGCVQTA